MNTSCFSRRLAAQNVFLTLMLVAALPAQAFIFDVAASDRGWYRESGQHAQQNQNTFTGGYAGIQFFRSYFSFELSQLKAPVTGARLRLELEGYLSNDAFEEVTVRDVSLAYVPRLDVDREDGDSLGQTIFEDLGSGSIYGHARVHIPGNAPVTGLRHTFMDFVLSDAAVADINQARGGRFAIGVALDDISPGPPVPIEGLRFSAEDEHRVHRLMLTSPVPEPTALSLFALGLAGLAWRWRRTKHQAT